MEVRGAGSLEDLEEGPVETVACADIRRQTTTLHTHWGIAERLWAMYLLGTIAPTSSHRSKMTVRSGRVAWPGAEEGPFSANNIRSYARGQRIGRARTLKSNCQSDKLLIFRCVHYVCCAHSAQRAQSKFCVHSSARVFTCGLRALCAQRTTRGTHVIVCTHHNAHNTVLLKYTSPVFLIRRLVLAFR